jgi:hypothetical protein
LALEQRLQINDAWWPAKWGDVKTAACAFQAVEHDEWYDKAPDVD